jgi:hypothetical protein
VKKRLPVQPLFIFGTVSTIKMKPFFAILVLSVLISCGTNNSGNPGDGSDSRSYENIPTERKDVNPNAVKTYSETVKSFETTDDFKVSLFETKQTFHYLIKIQYKNLDEEDTLKVPDFGIQPSVEIVKGDSIRPSCIVGFYDDKKQFRESKLVSFGDNSLKVKVLKHYAVTSGQNDAQ